MHQILYTYVHNSVDFADVVLRIRNRIGVTPNFKLELYKPSFMVMLLL